MDNPAKLIRNLLPQVKLRFEHLSESEVLVGVPQDKTAREMDVGTNNATLAYIHDNGSPAQNIPARPFMKPGIAAAKSDIIRMMKVGAQKALTGNNDAIEQTLHAIGLKTQSKIRAIINAGIAPALADSTLKARAAQRRGRKGPKLEIASRAAGNAPSMQFAKPLIDTGQLRNSINYVIRKRNNG